VVAGPVSTMEEPLSSQYLSAMASVLALNETDLSALRSVDLATRNMFVAGTLRAVRWYCSRLPALLQPSPAAAHTSRTVASLRSLCRLLWLWAWSRTWLQDSRRHRRTRSWPG
jgi:hypothetical protein